MDPAEGGETVRQGAYKARKQVAPPGPNADGIQEPQTSAKPGYKNRKQQPPAAVVSPGASPTGGAQDEKPPDSKQEVRPSAYRSRKQLQPETDNITESSSPVAGKPSNSADDPSAAVADPTTTSPGDSADASANARPSAYRSRKQNQTQPAAPASAGAEEPSAARVPGGGEPSNGADDPSAAVADPTTTSPGDSADASANARPSAYRSRKQNQTQPAAPHLLEQKNQVQLGRPVEENHQTVLTTLLQQLLIQRPHPQVTLRMLQQMQDRVRTGVASRIRLNLLPLHLLKQKNQVQLGRLVEENHQTVLTTLLQQLLIQRPHPQVTLQMLQQMQDRVRTGVASRIRLNLLPLHLQKQKE